MSSKPPRRTGSKRLKSDPWPHSQRVPKNHPWRKTAACVPSYIEWRSKPNDTAKP